ncbi:histone-lysine N-methyltransferase EZH2 [Micractinium conductrix]|uniref:Histone-lysine N-methyltransferase EZH2 n=1 Tax=Micractinium conductrix TaxID=554055 RepID=A0A2P6V593_9CHLO|nr:histone-lysine N-methyltransferase EZH2 [Micractinium conductrix]|eukprot:PSC69254.1 histone-lysine N-methyltransferase EZH2 [Micractinium conductrix]
MESLCAAPRLAGARTSVAAPLCTPSRQRDGRTVARAAAAAAAPPRSSTSPRRRHRRRCRQPSSGRDSGWGSPSADTLDWPASSGDSEDEDAELDLFPEESEGDPEFVVENVLATALIALAVLAGGAILFKLLYIAYALISAAVRYTAVGILLAVGLLAFQPGRWWF